MQTKKMEKSLYIEDIIVPLIAMPRNNNNKFQFIGSGFYIDKKGYLITCQHVVDSIHKDDSLFAYQIGKKRELKLEIVNKSDKYDLVLCKSKPPGLDHPLPFLDEPFITIGDDVEVFGYWYEPLGIDNLPFRTRYLKGHITGIPIDSDYSDSFELNFPILFGLSGSPLIYRVPIKDKSELQASIVGCVYGSRECSIIKHSIISVENETEKVARIVELGLAYKPKVLVSLFQGSDVSITTL